MEKIQKQSYSISPFIPAAFDIGQKKYGQVLYEGAKQVTSPTAIYENKTVTYITGLNETGPEVMSLPAEDRPKKILEIRKFIALCENELTGNYDVSPDNVEDKASFYKNVKTFKSVIPIEKDEYGYNATTIWDSFELELTNYSHILMSDNLKDRIIAYIAAAGGYSMVASSLSVAQTTGKYLFYFDSTEESASDRISLSRERNKAGALLELMLDKNTNKLFYVTKLISKNPLQWRTGTNASPVNLMYEACERFIEGEGKITSKKDAIEKFLSLASPKKDQDDLRIECYIQDGFLLGQLLVQTDGTVVHVPTHTPLGKGGDNLFAYLKAGGESEPVYKALAAAVEKEWKGE
jgi:hypothetical protein